ncbi:hypothetical protein NL676_034947 [Syzygium grande]|nr:hypothetical protein NL676_034947 [Syzygium grande]
MELTGSSEPRMKTTEKTELKAELKGTGTRERRRQKMEEERAPPDRDDRRWSGGKGERVAATKEVAVVLIDEGVVCA